MAPWQVIEIDDDDDEAGDTQPGCTPEQVPTEAPTTGGSCLDEIENMQGVIDTALGNAPAEACASLGFNAWLG